MNADQHTSADIGIDLGTTFSVIAVKGRVELAPDYPQGNYLAECDVTIIPTPDGDATFPSIYWVDPKDPDRVLIGIEAQKKAEEGDAPIMFSKRAIGTNEALKIHDKTCTAKQVATEILKYLKQCAERALGRPVARAVVTHPAYFEPNQVQETREAAVAAGFDMALPQQMMMEPAAAALAYTMGDDRDPLRVMTYDLGGGTFDVTVLERRQGKTTIKAFDGDHLLGGYNFDDDLVQWILDKLAAARRIIPYDENNPQDRGRRARMLQLAEAVKLNLARQRTDQTAVTINARDILVDAEGKPVQILEKINGQQYAALIKDHLDKTIQCCHQALGKAKMELQDLDTILLVGGSTYGPWVIKAVEDAFGVNVQPYNPDLCVAAGAARCAAELPGVARSEGLKLVLDVPNESPLPTIHVAGWLQADDGTDLDPAACTDLRVTLITSAGATREPQPLGAKGHFLFEDVALTDDGADNQLTLVVSTSNIPERLRKPFVIRYAPEGTKEEEIINVLPRPLYLKTGAGMKLIAEEGAPLPAKCEIEAIRAHSDSSVAIEVFQADRKVGEVRVDNIPEDAGEGCPVMISVEITEKNEMRGEAKVLNRNRVVAAACPVRISFPPLIVPELPELRQRFDQLEGQREEHEYMDEDPEQRLRLAGQGKKLSRQIAKLFARQSPDKQEVHRALKEFDRLVNPPPDEMEPSRAQYHNQIEACDQELAAAPSDPQIQAMRPLLTRIQTAAEDALATKNQRKWTEENEKLEKLLKRLQRLTGGGGGGGGGGGDGGTLPPTPVLKNSYLADVDGLRSEVQARREELQSEPEYEHKFKSHLDKIDRGIEQMVLAINKVSDETESRQAHGQLQLALLPKNKLKEDLRLVTVDLKTVKR
jgi:molecular chaperone DnaK (HSP70)